jgi:hypothetical protein
MTEVSRFTLTYQWTPNKKDGHWDWKEPTDKWKAFSGVLKPRMRAKAQPKKAASIAPTSEGKLPPQKCGSSIPTKCSSFLASH